MDSLGLFTHGEFRTATVENPSLNLFTHGEFGGEVVAAPPSGGGGLTLSDLNMATGTRIRVLKDNERRGLVGLEGCVVQSFPGYIVVELENDPLFWFRTTNAFGSGGFALPMRTPRRYFRVTEVERIGRCTKRHI